MPSHADRVRRHYLEAEPKLDGAPGDRAAVLARTFSELERYAGWLAKDQAAVAVRAGVQALRTAVNAGEDSLDLMATLRKDIARLPSGDIPKMLRASIARMQAELDAPTVQLSTPQC